MTTLANYLTSCQRLLHDATNQFYSQSELTDYINEARLRVVRDTGCLRQLITTTAFVQGQEAYPYASSITNGSNCIDILNINVIWGNSKIALDYLPWSRFNYQVRWWTLLQGRPIVFSVYGQNTFYVGPPPDQAYATEIDAIFAPTALVNPGDVETIPIPFQSPVPYYACYQAKQRMQEWDEARWFQNMYKSQVNSANNSSYTRRLSRAL